MFKKFCAVFAVIAISTNLCAFAQITEKDGTYREDFEGYTENADLLKDKTIFSGYTNKAPELVEKGGSQAMAVVSASNADSILLTTSEIFSHEINTIRFKITADSAPKVNWSNSTSVLFRYTNESGKVVNACLYDFAYNFIRNKVDGAEKVLVNFNNNKIYNASIQTTKTYREGNYYFNVTYTVDGKSFNLSYQTVEDGTMCIGFKSMKANTLYLDDVEISGTDLVQASLKEADRDDVAVNAELTLSFDGEVDDTTLGNITLNDLPIGNVQRADENQFTLSLGNALEKNTEYTLRLNDAADIKNNPIKNTEFHFKTKNTATVIESGSLKNLSGTESENVLKLAAAYQQGKMQDANLESVELQPGAVIPLENEKTNTVMTTDYRPIDADSFCDNTGVQQEAFSASFDEKTQKLIVAGKTARGVSDAYALVSVFDEEGMADYIQTLKTGDNGYFSMECVPSGISGTYHVNVKTLDESFEEDVQVRLAADAENLLAIVNDSNTTTAQMNVALEKYKRLLAIGMDLYDNITDKSNISNSILKAVAEDGKYTEVSRLAEDIKMLTVIYTMQSENTPYTIFQQYVQLLLSEQDALYEEWNKQTGKIQKEALGHALQESISTPKSFNHQLYTQMLLTIIGQSNKYAEVKTVIETYPDWLGISLTAYNKAGKPVYVAKGLYGTYRNQAAFKETFDRLVKTIPDGGGGQVGGGTTGGGKSNGGGGGGNVALPSKPTTTTTPQPTPTVQPIPGETPTASAAPMPEFTDMAGSKWASEAVSALCRRKIINGYTDKTFRPQNRITREEFIVMAVKCAGLEQEEACNFNDADENEWYYPYLAKAYAAKWIHGMADGSFGIGQNITRQDAAVILANLLSDDTEETENIQYSDESDIADYAAAAVQKLSKAKVINGNPDGSFEPNGFLTRAQAAKMIYGISE